MAAARWAICVPEAGLTGDLLPDGSASAVYTQADPRPGLCTPRDAAGRFRAVVSGAQETDLSVQVTRPGYVRASGGVAAAYDLDGDGVYRGWSPPNTVVQWTSDPTSWLAAGGITCSPAESAIVANPVTGRIVIVAGEDGVTAPRTMRYDPRSDTWSTGYTWSGDLPFPCAMAYDPDLSGRLLLWGSDEVAYFSDDDGATWQLYAVAGWSQAAADPQVAVAPGGLWLAVADERLWSSTDHGITWTMEEDLDALGSRFQVLRVPAGWLVVYVNTSSDLAARLLPYSRPVFSEAAAVVISAGTYTRLAAEVDVDGRVWLVGASGAPAQGHEVFVSTTSGATWTALQWGLTQSGGSADSGVGAVRLVASCGAIWAMAATGTAGGTDPTTDRIHLLRLGGWDSVESGPGLAAGGAGPAWRFGFGVAPTGGESLGLWLPLDEPDDTLYGVWAAVSTGTGGSWTFDADVGGELSASAGANGLQYRATASGSYATQAGHAQFRCLVGGPDLGTLGSPESKGSIVPKLGDGAYTYGVEIRLGADGLRVVDERGAGSQLGVVALDGEEWVYVRWHLTLGKVWVWVRGTTDTAWTTVCDGSTVTDEGATSVTVDRLKWGVSSVGSAATAIYWGVVAAAAGGGWHSGIDGIGEHSDTAADRALGLRFGRPLAPGLYPIPDAAPAGGALTWLGGLGGPAYTAEIVDVPVRYGSGVDRLDPRLSPSPRARWVSATDPPSVAEYIVWDAGSDLERYRGGVVALIGCGLQGPPILEYFASGSWNSLGGPVPPGNSTYTRTGRTLRPAGTLTSGNDHLNRYLWEGELVGGWVRVEDGASSGTYYWAQIRAQSAGWWDNTAGLQQATITIDLPSGYTGTDGGIVIRHHSGVYLADLGSIGSDLRGLRVWYASDSANAAPPHAAGVLTVARVVGLQAPIGWDWERRLELTRRVTRSEDGVTTSTTLGPPRRVWTGGWTDGADLRVLRAGGAVTTIGAGTGQVGSAEDPWGLWGLLEHGALSGEMPVAVLARPTLGATTDPTLWVWGRITSDGHSVSGVLGEEGANEIVRVDGLTVEEIR